MIDATQSIIVWPKILFSPLGLGHKNWLFSNSPTGGKASADLYSLTETAKENSFNPYDYLKEVLHSFQMQRPLRMLGVCYRGTINRRKNTIRCACFGAYSAKIR
ncbi:MAG: transposase domain-containing protein [Gammaproteobacteria bacterium]|nr:transposase domain-containing protein [Gammaproteobacteria bacterium]